MTKTDFLNDLALIMNVEPIELTAETQLQSLENWDSVAYLSTIVLIDDRLGMSISPDALQSASTVGDLLLLVNERLAA